MGNQTRGRMTRNTAAAGLTKQANRSTNHPSLIDSIIIIVISHTLERREGNKP